MVRHHPEELVQGGPEERVGGGPFAEVGEQRERLFMVSTTAPMRVDEDVRVKRDHGASRAPSARRAYRDP